MNYQEQRERKARSKRRWNSIGVALLFLFPPAAIGVWIANGLDMLPNIGGNLDIKRSVDQLRDLWQDSSPAERPETNRRVKGLPNGGGLISAIGAILMAGAVLGGGITLGQFLDGAGWTHLAVSLGLFSVAAGGLVTTIFGGLRRKKKARFEAYLKLIGDKQAVPIHYLADVMGIDYHKVIKDLREMISRGILQPAWLDLKTYRLMMTEYTEQQVEQPEEKPEEAVSRSDRILRQIRADNDLIADEEVSRKIDRIEDLTRKIFAILAERPEKEAQLYQFLNYYLPTTLKALESYARLEAQGIETASIREAKQKINRALDDLAEGYEAQLDRLFADDVVDITADIDVMRQMLRKDGLKEDEIAATVSKK